MDLLKHYNYTIGYRLGTQNSAADTLSRRVELMPEDPEEETPITMIPPERLWEIAEISEQEYEDCLVALIQQETLTDREIRERIMVTIQGKEVPPTIKIHEGVPYHGEQIYVPNEEGLRERVLQLYHDSLIAGHLGQRGTLDLIRRQYWWEEMAKTIREYITECHTCTRNKHPNTRLPGLMTLLPIPLGPWEWTQSDHITRLPKSGTYDAIYVVMDRFTKMTHFIPTRTTAMAEDLVQLHLKHVWKIHGVPKIHNTDRGTTFTADYTRRFFKGLGIDQRFSMAYHPQTQGQVENNNKWVETYIRMFCNHQQNNWSDLLHTAEFAYNNHTHPTIGMSPFRANYGYDMTLTGEGPTRGQDIPLRLATIH
jgi:transposase InsO family protein